MSKYLQLHESVPLTANSDRINIWFVWKLSNARYVKPIKYTHTDIHTDIYYAIASQNPARRSNINTKSSLVAASSGFPNRRE